MHVSIQTEELTAQQIGAIRTLQSELRLTVTALASKIGGPSRDTLGRALRGRPIWIVDHQRIVAWLERESVSDGPRRTNE